MCRLSQNASVARVEPGGALWLTCNAAEPGGPARMRLRALMLLQQGPCKHHRSLHEAASGGCSGWGTSEADGRAGGAGRRAGTSQPRGSCVACQW